MRSVILAVVAAVVLTACGAGHDTTTQANTKAATPIAVNQATPIVSAGPPPAEPDATAPPQPSQASMTTLHLQRTIRVPALAGGPAAGVCSSRWPRVIVIDMNPDTPAPRCVSASAGNIIEVVNRTDGFGQHGHSMTISWASFPPVTLRPGQSAIFDAPVGSYLAPGDHVLQTRAYPDGPLVPPEGAEIYVRDATHTAGSP